MVRNVRGLGGVAVTKAKTQNVSLQEVVGKGYAEFWNSKRTYVATKGGRASKKSKTAALWHITSIMKYPLSNVLVVRKVERTLRDSCYSDLLWAIERLGVSSYWKCTTSPLEMTYVPTGQKIIFRGLDSPFKITSISVPHGVLNFLWIEECYEITKESDFDILDESIRGVLPDGYFKRITLTFNPWSERHWLKSRFFDNPSDNVLALTTTYLCNEWLSETDCRLFEDMRKRNPRRYNVAGLGNWGVVDGLVYERWREAAFTIEQLPEDAQTVCGLDFGYTNDPTAFMCGFLSLSERRLYVWDEFYKKGLSNRALCEEVTRMGYSKERIIADSAEPKSIDELRYLGLRVSGARKGKGSINAGIQWIQDLEIVIHPRCVAFMTEISSYSWEKDKFNQTTNIPEDDNCHLMDAMRYALEAWITGGRAKVNRNIIGGI